MCIVNNKILIQMENKSLVALDKNAITQLTKAGVIPNGTPSEQIYIFSAICKEQNLSPFSKEIYLVGYGGNYSPITGINGLRKKAVETGAHAGCSVPMFDLQPSGTFKTAAQYKRGETPTTCTIIIKKVVQGHLCEFASTVVFSEFSSGRQKWASMPFQMIAKVAEAHAIRKAYAITGLHIEEEGAAFMDSTIKVQETKPHLTPDDALWGKALAAIKAGKKTFEALAEKYSFSKENEELFMSQLNEGE